MFPVRRRIFRIFSLQYYLQDHCRLLAVEPPGHGTNRMDLVDNLEKLVDIYMNELIPRLEGSFVFFGHSREGVFVYRLAQKLEQQSIFPKAVIISAVQPPHIRPERVTHFDDDRFLNHVISIGGIPDELLNERAMLEFFLPAFRSDFIALETFSTADTTVLQSPVHVFNGQQDEQCLNVAWGWREWADQIWFHQFQGGHKFFLSEIGAVAQRIRSILTSSMNERVSDTPFKPAYSDAKT